MVKVKPSKLYNKIYSDSSSNNSTSFLKTIKDKIKEIKSNINDNKKYSLLSVIILCFIEKGKSFISRNEIFDFVKNEIMNNPNKIISTYKFKKIKNDMVTEQNYNIKLYQSLCKNRIFNKILSNDRKTVGYEINFEFLNKRKYILYNEMFGEYLSNSIQMKKRKIIQFENSLSVIKKPKTLKKIRMKKASKENEIKNNTAFEIDTSTFSIKESEIKAKKSEETSITNSNSNLIESIKQLDQKKMGFIDINNYVQKNESTSINKDNSNISSNENSLIMPLFTDAVFNDKSLKYKNLNMEANTEICSNTLKEINIIISKGKEFLSLLKNPQLLNLLNSNDNYKKLGTSILSLPDDNDNYTYNLLKTASDNYTEFCQYLDFFLYERKKDRNSIYSNCDIKLNKIKCELIISSIITKLIQFHLEYNYFVEIIEEIFNYEHNFILNEMIKIINYDRNVLSKDNIDCLENLLKFELDNAITYQE